VAGESRRTCGCRVAPAVSAWLAFAASPAAAHGFGQRFDLPLPLWLWVTGAGATIVLTFAAIALFVRAGSFGTDYPRVDLLRFAPFRWIERPWIVAFVRLLAALLFSVTICAGFFGAQSPYANLITTMVWVVWWVGFAFVCALVGDLWALVNPLRTLFAWGKALHATLFRSRSPARKWTYPEWLGVWPGVALFLCFAWAELVWRDNDIPAYLAWAVVGYSLITWIGMFLYGRDAWLANGEAFSIAFGVLARFAPLEVGPPGSQGSERRLFLRPLGAGLLTRKPVRFSFMVFVLLMLATVTFDGFQETPLMQRIDTAVNSSPTLASLLFDLSEWGFDESQLIHTAALVTFPLAFLAVFWIACWSMVILTRRSASGDANVAKDLRVNETARAFVLTLVPIAVAYHLSHYFSLLLTAGQFIIPLVSDPFGFGWNLFGTAKYKVDLGIVSPYVFWYCAVTIIVIGHVIAVLVAHGVALRVFGNRRDALVSQIPMVLLMVAYTTLSLWILAQPIVG
jgi:hypothetical protein